MTSSMTVPKDPYTSVGDSKRPNGSTTYCSKAAKTDVSQGEFPSNFWTHREFRAGTGPKGGKVVQRASLGGAEGFLLNETVTGCINPAAMDRLNASDPGGQYDSKPGSDGSSTVCIGYVCNMVMMPRLTGADTTIMSNSWNLLVREHVFGVATTRMTVR